MDRHNRQPSRLRLNTPLSHRPSGQTPNQSRHAMTDGTTIARAHLPRFSSSGPPPVALSLGFWRPVRPIALPIQPIPMSTTHSLSDAADITKRSECNYPNCDDRYEVGVADTAPFCSTTCRWRATALGIFEDIKHDRRFCNNCYRQIRELYEQGRWLRSRKVKSKVWYVNRPGRKYPIYTKSPGDPYAYFKQDGNRKGLPLQSQPTKHTVRGTSDRLSLSDPSRHNYQTADDPTPSSVCVCGVTHHTTTGRPIKLDPMMEYAKRLSDVLSKLEAEENHEPVHDRDILLDEVRARKTDPSNHTPDQHIFINAIAEAIRE